MHTIVGKLNFKAQSFSGLAKELKWASDDPVLSNGSFKTSLVTYPFPALPWAKGTSSSLAMAFKCLRLSPRVTVPKMWGRSSARQDPTLKSSWTAARGTVITVIQTAAKPISMDHLMGSDACNVSHATWTVFGEIDKPFWYSFFSTICSLRIGCSMRVAPLLQ